MDRTRRAEDDFWGCADECGEAPRVSTDSTRGSTTTRTQSLRLSQGFAPREISLNLSGSHTHKPAPGCALGCFGIHISSFPAGSDRHTADAQKKRLAACLYCRRIYSTNKAPK